MQEICPMKRFIHTPKCTKMRLVAGLGPDPAAGGAYSAPPGPLAGLRGKESEWGVGKGKGLGRPKAPLDTQNA